MSKNYICKECHYGDLMHAKDCPNNRDLYQEEVITDCSDHLCPGGSFHSIIDHQDELEYKFCSWNHLATWVAKQTERINR